jgi:hypothetical protein
MSTLRDGLVQLAARARDAGRLPPSADPQAVGQATLSLGIGWIVQRLVAASRTVTPTWPASGPCWSGRRRRPPADRLGSRARGTTDLKKHGDPGIQDAIPCPSGGDPVRTGQGACADNDIDAQ